MTQDKGDSIGSIGAPILYADAGDPGLRFILPAAGGSERDGGLARNFEEGHFGTIVGRGGSGKSILALQIVTALLDRADLARGRTEEEKRRWPHAAFYFTLEASPKELLQQVRQFTWGRERYTAETEAGKTDKKTRVSGENEYSHGLYLCSIPSPVDSLNALNLQIRQIIARQLSKIESLVAIVIDPMGAISAEDDLRADLSELKNLSETHRTFVFLLSEKHAFEKHTSIEHYSQSIIHLEHDPGQQPHRRLHVQKARGQSFRSGYHRFELQEEHGVRVYPSIGAQSAYAHELLLLNRKRQATARPEKSIPFMVDEKERPVAFDNQGIEPGSALFLMGPPGSFKEQISIQFARAAGADAATLYISFKADIQAIRKETTIRVVEFDSRNQFEDQFQDAPARDKKPKHKIFFFDARSPLLTPEEILFAIRNTIAGPGDSKRESPSAGAAYAKKKPVLVGHADTKEKPLFRRAIVWGLRRLYDFPNFREGRPVEFLEALVTLLKSHRITSLLVDWPDQHAGMLQTGGFTQAPRTAPIVDLCQYIFLTRLFVTEAERAASERKAGDASSDRRGSSPIYTAEQDAVLETYFKRAWTNARQVALLRAQRTPKGLHHDQGLVLKQMGSGQYSFEKPPKFEDLWHRYGKAWESDVSLQS